MSVQVHPSLIGATVSGWNSVGEEVTGRVVAVYVAGEALYFVVVDEDGRLHYVECVHAVVITWPEEEKYE